MSSVSYLVATAQHNSDLPAYSGDPSKAANNSRFNAKQQTPDEQLSPKFKASSAAAVALA